MAELTVRRVDQVTDEIVQAAQEIVDGWYPKGRIDWEDVWDRLDGASLEDGTVLDLGDNLLSPALVYIKKEIQHARKANG